jgi:MazG family protein
LDTPKAQIVSNHNKPPLLEETPYERLKELMTRLRTDCPWDSQQSFETIAPYTIEEAYEVDDAISRGNMGELREELGDLLFQVVFHAKLAEEENAFDMDDVTTDLVEKMVRRHPHVFGNAESDALDINWEKMKAEERKAKGQTSQLDGVALGLPALMRAQKLQKRAAKVGFDWPSAEPVWDKIQEESDEVKSAIASGNKDAIEEELGDLLFTVVNLSRKLGVDSEIALRKANRKFTKRFTAVEAQAEADTNKAMSDYTLDELEAFWQKAKEV